MEKTTKNVGKNEEFIDITAIINKYIKYWYLFAISIIGCMGLAYVYLKITSPVYQISANVLIKEEDGKSGGGIQSALMKNFSFGGMMGGSDVEDELHVISSHSLLKQAVEKLGLNKSYHIKTFLRTKDCYQNTPIEIIADEAIMDTLSTALNFKLKISQKGNIQIDAFKGKDELAQVTSNKFPVLVKTSYGNFVFNKTSFYKEGESLKMAIGLYGYDMTAESLNKNVDFGLASKKANVIALGIKEIDIKRGKDLLNTILALFNEDGIKEKNIEAENTAKFINERLSLISTDLNLAEKDIETYKKANNLTDIEEEAKLILSQNSTFRAKLIETETQYSVISLIEDFIKDPNNKYSLVPFSVGLDDRSAVEAIQGYNGAILERMKLLRSTNENNPMVQTMNEQVGAMRKNVIATVSSMKQGIGIALNDLKNQENTILSRIKGMPTQEREFIDIKRQQVIKEELFIFLLQKKEENALTLAVTSPKGRIIDQAYNLNEPLKPKKMMIVLLAFALGCILPILYLYIKNLLTVKFANKGELELLTSIPILGEVCLNNSKNNLVVQEGKTTAIVELFRLLRTNIQFVLSSKNEKVILVTSSISGEGKSFISSNFAMSLALMGKKVLLMGIDIRNPQLATYLNLSSKSGLTNYLASSDESLDPMIIRSALHANLDVILAGPVPPNPAELLLSEKLDRLFEELRKQYDYIIIDSAPVGMVSDTFCLTRLSDATIYVCRANYTRKDNIKYVTKLVEENKLKKVSLVLNGTQTKQGYGYGYGQKKK